MLGTVPFLSKNFLVRGNSGVCKGPGVERRMRRRGSEDLDGRESRDGAGTQPRGHGAM